MVIKKKKLNNNKIQFKNNFVLYGLKLFKKKCIQKLFTFLK